jgi:prepilin peptidase CpaA
VPLPEIVRYCVATAFTGVLAWASVSDIRSRRIPNAAVLALIGLFVPWAAADMGATALSSLAAAGIALVIGVGLYAFKVVGAGDSKLFTAVALFAGMDYLLYFGVATALAGGLIAGISLAARPQRALVMFTLRGKGDYGSGVPYGVAIAIGGILVIWGMLTGLIPPFGSPGQLSVNDLTSALRR